MSTTTKRMIGKDSPIFETSKYAGKTWGDVALADPRYFRWAITKLDGFVPNKELTEHYFHWAKKKAMAWDNAFDMGEVDEHDYRMNRPTVEKKNFQKMVDERTEALQEQLAAKSRASRSNRRDDFDMQQYIEDGLNAAYEGDPSNMWNTD